MSDLLEFDPTKLYHKMVEAGNDWADKQAAYQVLDDTRNTVLARLMQASKAPSVAAKEIDAKASKEYEQHIKAAQEAQSAALKARVKYDAIRTWIDLQRTRAANERALTKL
jgi:hypothetical protein